MALTFEPATSKIWSLDPATGQRQPRLTLAQPNGEKVFVGLSLADDPTVYSSWRQSHGSVLFVVEGIR